MVTAHGLCQSSLLYLATLLILSNFGGLARNVISKKLDKQKSKPAKFQKQCSIAIAIIFPYDNYGGGGGGDVCSVKQDQTE